MSIQSFITIIGLKILAIIIIILGIYCQLQSNHNTGDTFITVGSLVFAIASNTTLFIYVLNNKKKQGR